MLLFQYYTNTARLIAVVYSFVTEGSAASRNSAQKSWIVYVYTKESSWNRDSDILEPDRPQFDKPAGCVVAQQYSSATFVISRCYSPGGGKKLGTVFKKKMLSFQFLHHLATARVKFRNFKMPSRGMSATVGAGVRGPQLLHMTEWVLRGATPTGKLPVYGWRCSFVGDCSSSDAIARGSSVRVRAFVLLSAGNVMMEAADCPEAAEHFCKTTRRRIPDYYYYATGHHEPPSVLLLQTPGCSVRSLRKWNILWNWIVNSTPDLQNGGTDYVLLKVIITFDLSSLRGPTSGDATTWIVLSVIWPYKPH